MKKHKIIPLALSLLWSCSMNNSESDAYGNFEAVEIMVSSEGNGKLMSFNLEEGDQVDEDQIVGYIDTIQLHLKKQQLKASIEAVGSKTQDVQIQVDVLEKKKANLLRERKRVEALLVDSAATTKQLDDINGEIAVVKRQIDATKSQLTTTNRGLLSEIKPIHYQIQQLEDQTMKCILRNPQRGTVLTKYVEESEIVAMGKPLYKIADLDEIFLRAYLSGKQVSNVKIGQTVSVLIDDIHENYKQFSGTITWISSSAEFTPKVVQTKDERVNMVYAFKVKVKNDGSIKIGMPGEVRF
jgi:HlyD family secretion protein